MRKLICYWLFVSLVFLSCTKTDVGNNQIASAKNNLSADKFTMMVAKAKHFFETQISTSVSQKFKKTPIWERASYAKMKSGAEKIIVPLKYDKDYSFKTSFSGDQKFTLEKQSLLSIYKDASGNYQAEVVTTFPSESYLKDMSQPFQGLLTIDDWNENRIRAYLHKDGKLYNIGKSDFNSADNSSQIAGRTNEICMTVDWYWCEGYPVTCTYLLTTYYENCNDFQTLLPPGEEGEYVYEQTRGKFWQWRVATTVSVWGVDSREFVMGTYGGFNSCNGIFNPSGRLTSIDHHSSNLTITSDPDYSWTQTGGLYIRYNNCEVESQVVGRVTYTPNGQWTQQSNYQALTFSAWYNL